MSVIIVVTSVLFVWLCAETRQLNSVLFDFGVVDRSLLRQPGVDDSGIFTTASHTGLVSTQCPNFLLQIGKSGCTNDSTV